jgi:hypothetical protein
MPVHNFTMEKHTDTNATRQRNFRLDAAKEFGVKPGSLATWQAWHRVARSR